MSETGEVPPKPAEVKPGKSLSEIGAGYLLRAASRYPASNTAQAARIALLCQDTQGITRQT